MKTERSRALYDEAKRVLPGGVDSPVRAFNAVGGTPRFIKKAQGSKLQDEDGNRYIDYVSSWGALILGSAHPRVTQAIHVATTRGTSYGAPTKLETQLASMIINQFPSIQKLRFVNSGTEATMSALRLARAYTKRDKILKFEGCYHGHADSLLVKGGSGMATFGVPNSAGVTKEATSDTIVASYNDLSSVKLAFEQNPDNIAAIVVEPIAANMGLVLPKPEYLQGLRDIAKNYGSLLIFDEVITGFRASVGGAQKLYRVTPDLTCLGKIIGGGLPVGAYGGPNEIMNLVAPIGPVYQAGTLSGNPLAMSAGIATLAEVTKPGFYNELDHVSSILQSGLLLASQKAQVDTQVTRVGSMLGVFFTNRSVYNYEDVKSSNTAAYVMFFNSLLKRSVYFPPSPFETIFVSAAHTKNDISKTVDAAFASFLAVSESQSVKFGITASAH